MCLPEENHLLNTVALDDIPQVYKTDVVAQLYTMPDQHIFTLLLLPTLTGEQESTVKSNVITTIAIVTFTV